MYVVAITNFVGPLDVEVEILSRELALTPYDSRHLLASGTPAIVQRTPSKQAALDLLARLRSRGHGAVVCDTATLVPSSAMVQMHNFYLEADAVSLDARPEHRLRYDAIVAFICARWRHSRETSKQEFDPFLSAARVIGFFNSYVPIVHYAVSRETHVTLDERERVLYMFPVIGTPWLLREHGTNWQGLGTLLAPAESTNFQVTVAALRERAPRAIYDERLLHLQGLSERVTSLGSATSIASTEDGVTLLAQIVAFSLTGETVQE